MAISEVHFRLLCELRDRGTFTPGGSLLEIGEANHYGDFDPQIISDEKFKQTGWRQSSKEPFELARMIYDATIKPTHTDAIDMHGERAMTLDLNKPLNLGRTYETVINNGTAEHIFNTSQVFVTMHDACAVGGVMIHESPFVGCIDHGLFHPQPTMFYDLAHANNYRIEMMGVEDINGKKFTPIYAREDFGKLNGEMPKNAYLFVVFRKLFAGAFRIPMQAVYSGMASEQTLRTWDENR